MDLDSFFAQLKQRLPFGVNNSTFQNVSNPVAPVVSKVKDAYKSAGDSYFRAAVPILPFLAPSGSPFGERQEQKE